MATPQCGQCRTSYPEIKMSHLLDKIIIDFKEFVTTQWGEHEKLISMNILKSQKIVLNVFIHHNSR